jgi:tape measure domain-containing protein
MADSSIEIQISARGADQVVKDFKAINAQVTALNKKIGNSAGINKFVKSMADASKNFTKALKSMEQALNKIKGSTQAVQNAQKQQSNARSQQIRNQIADLRALGTAERQANRLQARFDRAGFNSGSGPANALRGLRGDIAGLPSGGPERTLAMVAAQQKYNRAIDASQEKFRGLNGTVDTAVRRTGRLGNSFSGLRGILLNTGVALSGITAILGFREILDAVRTIQRFQFTIQAASGSAQIFGKNLEFLRGVSKSIGINLAEVGQPFGRFIMAAKEAGFETDETNQAFAKIAGSMRNLGGSAADTAGVVRAFEQSLSKGKFMAEEVRLQLGDRLPVAMTALRKATGMTGEELNDAFEKGKLSTEKFFLPFVDALFEATGGENQLRMASKGLAAEQARLATATLEAADAFGRGENDDGFTSAVSEANRELTAMLSEASTIQFLERLGTVSANAARSFMQMANAFFDIAMNMGPALKTLEDGSKQATQVPRTFMQAFAEMILGTEAAQAVFNPGGGLLPVGGNRASPHTGLKTSIGMDQDFGFDSVTPEDRQAALMLSMGGLKSSYRPPSYGKFSERRNEALLRTSNPGAVSARRAGEDAEALALNPGKEGIAELQKYMQTAERTRAVVDALDVAIVKGTVTTAAQASAFNQNTLAVFDNKGALEDHISTVQKEIDADKDAQDEKDKNKVLLKELKDSISTTTTNTIALASAQLKGTNELKKASGQIEINNTVQKAYNDLIALGESAENASNLTKTLRLALQQKLNTEITLAIELEQARLDAEAEADRQRAAREAARAREEKARAQGKIDDVARQIQNMDAENDAMRRGATALKKFNAALAEENLLRDIEKKLTDENISAKEREFLLDEMRRVQSERKIAQRGPQTLTDGFLAAGDTLKDYFDPDNYDSPGAALENSLVGAFGTATDALETFIKGGKVSFQDLRDQIIIDISFAMAKAFAMKAMTAAFGFADGGIMTGSGPMPLRSYARGGVANSPQMALFGEGSTPEAYVPLPDGRTIPVTMKGGGGGMTVVQNFDFSNADGSTVANLRQAASVIQEQTKQAIYAEMQDGGNVAKISGRR